MRKLIGGIQLGLALMLVSSIVLADEKAEHKSHHTLAVEAGWPDTPVGVMAYAWIDAFDTRDEKVMASFLEVNLMEGALEKRSMNSRMTSYRRLLKMFGVFVLSSVVESSDYELTVDMTAEDNRRARFTFFLDDKAPHKLEKVTIAAGHH